MFLQPSNNSISKTTKFLHQIFIFPQTKKSNKNYQKLVVCKKKFRKNQNFLSQLLNVFNSNVINSIIEYVFIKYISSVN